jgi:hypothetical protein
MGFNVSWLAIQAPKKDVLATLKFAETTQDNNWNEEPFSGGELQAGWYLVFNNGFDLLDDRYLAAGSKVGRLIGVAMLEGSTTSAAMEWRAGRQIWSVQHDGENGADGNLEEKGTLPAEYFHIRDDLKAKQRGSKNVDYIFDVAIELAARIAGFRPDNRPLLFAPKFVKLRKL